MLDWHQMQDEPTTGLDSTTAVGVLTTIKRVQGTLDSTGILPDEASVSQISVRNLPTL